MAGVKRQPDFACIQFERTLPDGNHLYYQPGAMRHLVLSDEDVAEQTRRVAYDKRRQAERQASADAEQSRAESQRREMISGLKSELPHVRIEAIVEALWSHEHVWSPRPEVAPQVKAWIAAGVTCPGIIRSAVTREMSPAGTVRALAGLGLLPNASEADVQRKCGTWLGNLLERKGIRGDKAPPKGWGAEYGDKNGGVFSPGWVWE